MSSHCPTKESSTTAWHLSTREWLRSGRGGHNTYLGVMHGVEQVHSGTEDQPHYPAHVGKPTASAKGHRVRKNCTWWSKWEEREVTGELQCRRQLLIAMVWQARGCSWVSLLALAQHDLQQSINICCLHCPLPPTLASKTPCTPCIAAQQGRSSQPLLCCPLLVGSLTPSLTPVTQ
jgi:hypothetical protein